jgi:hypothetical protein
MKKTRFEIYKFAQTGLRSEEKQKSKLELAIALGAKPAKNKYTNYKELLKEKKELAAQNKEKNHLKSINRQFNATHKTGSKKAALAQKRRNASGILNIYGKVSRTLPLLINNETFQVFTL